MLLLQLQLNGCGESHGGEATTDDPELLLSVLEARELVEEIGDPEQLHHMQADNLKKQEECIQVGERETGQEHVHDLIENERYW